MARNTNKQKDLVTMSNKKILLLEELCNASAVSGDEGAIRNILRRELEGYAEKITIDPIGNLLVDTKKSKEGLLKVLIAAHMDEVGFMIVDDGDEGTYRFEIVGGIDKRQIPGKAVWVGKDNIPGVIGTIPPHLSKDDDKGRPIPIDSLRIDVGLDSNKKVKKGERAAFATSFQRIDDSMFGKAFDNRIGVATLIELIKDPPANVELMAAFTVQEEIGLRGAKVAAYRMQPDMAIALDCTPANDLPMWDESENYTYNTRLRAGPAIYVADQATLSDPRLVQFAVKTAEKYKIPFQIRQPGGGGTDAGMIHLQREGIPSLSISVPARYHHTARMLVSVSDWENSIKLIKALLSDMNASVFKKDR